MAENGEDQEIKRRREKVEKRTKRKNILSSFLTLLITAALLIGSITTAVFAGDYEAGKPKYQSEDPGNRRRWDSGANPQCEVDTLQSGKCDI